MGLNKSGGNMYNFITHTWNTVKGKCPHSCQYCFMKRWGPQPELHFDEEELKTDLYKYGENQFVFVGSSCDMWAEEIPPGYKTKTINHCRKYPKNQYLYQSKNPKNFLSTILKKNTVYATTIETNRAYPEMGKAPPIWERAHAIRMIKEQGFKTMITLEPIMDFDFRHLLELIRHVEPDWVSIGADSQGHGLPEPGPEKIKKLLTALSKFTKILPKPNLKRLL